MNLKILFFILYQILTVNCISRGFPFGTRPYSSTKPLITFSFQDRRNINVPDQNKTQTILEPWWRRNRITNQRRLEFWKRAGRIYTSYKLFQLQQVVKIGFAWITHRRSLNSTRNDAAAWNQLHEINSQRMLNLSLHLRGFYLKSGQFLGTRHDFMPEQYTSKLIQLHDQVPPMSPQEVKLILEKELQGNLTDYFTEIDLEEPIGSASIAQVHIGIWKKTKEKVAVKVQNPLAKPCMTDDLRNLGILADFLQKTELKFDLVSAVKELRSQIIHEFDFRQEAKNMDEIRSLLVKKVPDLLIPRSIFSSERVLVMSFIEGDNLSKLARKHRQQQLLQSPSPLPSAAPSFVLKQYGRHLLNTLAEAWGYQIFVFNHFHCDPHGGNICLQPRQRKIGLLDWGQMKSLPKPLQLKFATLIQALAQQNTTAIIDQFQKLGVRVANPNDLESLAGLAITLFDTTYDPKYVFSPFQKDSYIKKNPILSIPPDLFFIVRTVQLFRGMSYSLGIRDFSIAKKWAPFAQQVLDKEA